MTRPKEEDEERKEEVKPFGLATDRWRAPMNDCVDARTSQRRACEVSPSVVRSAAAFAMASSVYGYAHKDEGNDYQQHCDDYFHDYSPRSDSMCPLIR